jgi:hypothetical protein
MTVNQRLRTLKSVGRVDVLSCYPDAFPPDIGVGSVRIIRAPISTRMPPGPMRLSAFTIDAALYAIAAWIMGRRYQVTYTLQDTSAVAGWLLHGRRGCWVIDAVDDPALELRNAQIQGSQVKVLGLGTSRSGSSPVALILFLRSAAVPVTYYPRCFPNVTASHPRGSSRSRKRSM